VDWNEAHARRFRQAMDDDFGTPEAVAVLFDLANEVNRSRGELAPQLRALGAILGILQRRPEEFLHAGPGGAMADDEIERRIARRAELKKQKNYAAADAEREALAASGILLEDGPQGTVWRRR
jgi:cysteinyl-tRNA synthetase